MNLLLEQRNVVLKSSLLYFFSPVFRVTKSLTWSLLSEHRDVLLRKVLYSTTLVFQDQFNVNKKKWSSRQGINREKNTNGETRTTRLYQGGLAFWLFTPSAGSGKKQEMNDLIVFNRPSLLRHLREVTLGVMRYIVSYYKSCLSKVTYARSCTCIHVCHSLMGVTKWLSTAISPHSKLDKLQKNS